MNKQEKPKAAFEFLSNWESASLYNHDDQKNASGKLSARTLEQRKAAGQFYGELFSTGK